MNTDKNIKTKRLQLETLNCPTCVTKIEGALNKMKGVQEAKVLFNSSKVKIVYNEAEVESDSLVNLIEKLGYPVVA